MLLRRFFQQAPLQLYLWLLLLPLLALFWGANSYFRNNTVERLERYFFDSHSSNLAEVRIVPEIVLVLAGEDSIARLGRWPWPRETHARLLDRLKSAHTVVLDILFPETSSRDQDQELVSAAGRINNLVLGAHKYTPPGSLTPVLKRPIIELDRQAIASGYTNLAADVDGLVRYMVPFSRVGEHVTPAFSLAAAATVIGQPLKADSTNLSQIEKFLADTANQTDEDNRIWLPLSHSAFSIYEYADVIEDRVPPETFAGKVVVVGVSASGAEDFFSVPSPGGSREISGAELNGMLMATLLSSSSPQRMPRRNDALLTCSLVLAGALLGALARPRSSFWGLILLVAGFYFSQRFLFISKGIWFAQALPFMGLLSTFSLFMFMRYRMQHMAMQVKNLSISYINNLPELLGQKEGEFESYLLTIWPDIEKRNGIFLLHPRTTLEEQSYLLAADIDAAALSSPNSPVVVESGTGPYRFLALVPLQGGKTELDHEYTMLGWHKRFDDEHIEAIVAIVLSTSWFFEVLRQAKVRKQMLLDTIEAIATAIDAKDPVTGGHSHRVSNLVAEITRHLDLDSQTREDIFLGALIHDIGKIGVPDSILTKPGQLTTDEYEKMMEHPDIGHRIMQSVQLPVNTMEGLRQHHERFDGSGYPTGIAGQQISLAGRIIAVADVYDALLSERPYSSAIPLEQVRRFMHERKETEFDPHIIDALLAIKSVKSSQQQPLDSSVNNQSSKSAKENI